MAYSISPYGRSSSGNWLAPILDAIQYNDEKAENLRRWEAQHAIQRGQYEMAQRAEQRDQREFDAEIYDKEFKRKALEWGDLRYKRDGAQRIKRTADKVIKDPRFMRFLEQHNYTPLLGPRRSGYSGYTVFELKPGVFAIGMKDPATGKMVPLSATPDGKDPQTFTKEEAEQVLDTLETGIRKKSKYDTLLQLDQELDRGLIGTPYDPQLRDARAAMVGLTPDELSKLDAGYYTGRKHSRSHRAGLDQDTLRKIEQIDPSVPGQRALYGQAAPVVTEQTPQVEPEATPPTGKSGNFYQQILAESDNLSDFERTKLEHNAAVLADIERRYESKELSLEDYNAEIKKAQKQKIGAIDGRLINYTGLPGAQDAWWDDAARLGIEAIDWAKKNPAEAVSMGIMLVPGAGWVIGGSVKGLAALHKVAKAKKWSEKAIGSLKNLNIAGRRALGTTTRKYGKWPNRVQLNKKTYKTKEQAERALRASNFGKTNAHKVVQNKAGEWTLAPTMGNIATGSSKTMFGAGAIGYGTSKLSGDTEKAEFVAGISPTQQARADKSAEDMSVKQAKRVLDRTARYAKFKQLAALKVLQDANEIPADSVANFMETGKLTMSAKELMNAQKEEKAASLGDAKNVYELYAGNNDNPYFSELEVNEYVTNTSLGGFGLNISTREHAHMAARALQDMEKAARSGENNWIPFDDTDKSELVYQALDAFLALRMMNRNFSESERASLSETLSRSFDSLDPNTSKGVYRYIVALVNKGEDVEDAIIKAQANLAPALKAAQN